MKTSYLHQTILRKFSKISLIINYTVIICLFGLLSHTTNSMAANKGELRIGGSGTDLSTMSILCKAFSATNSEIRCVILKSLGSGGGIRAVQSAKLDIGLTSRPLKKKEYSPGLKIIQYARTPLVFVVEKSNPVNSITSTQLANLYSGKQLRWSNGNVARPILRPTRDSDSLLVMKELPSLRKSLVAARQRRGVSVGTTDQVAAEMLANVPGAFGTTSLAVILSEQRPLKPLTLDNVAPTIENAKKNLYRFQKKLFLVYKAPVTPLIKKYLKFIQSPEGMKILEQTGHINIGFAIH